jgi:hypothetical protein
MRDQRLEDSYWRDLLSDEPGESFNPLRTMIFGSNGLPLALIEAAELASQHAKGGGEVIVPIELVSLSPAAEGGNCYEVAYLHPVTHKRMNCDRLLQLPSPGHFRYYENWLARVQRVGIDRLIGRRRWWQWGR